MTISDLINLKKAELHETCQILASYSYDKTQLEKQINDLINANKKEIIVTDHAIIRYFERVLKLDVDKVRKELSKPSLLTRYRVLGDQTYDMGEYMSVIANGHVITILNKER